jgi:hypothetical protein
MESYFTTIAEAAATLTGLIFVGLSLNLQRILSIKHLPARALGSLMLMTNILIISSFCLLTQQPIFWLGIEVLICGLTIWVVITRMDILMYREMVKQYKYHYFRNRFLPSLPYCLTWWQEYSYYQDQRAVFTGWCRALPFIIKALTDSWVLLVEINR